jgi:hypothetical protein
MFWPSANAAAPPMPAASPVPTPGTTETTVWTYGAIVRALFTAFLSESTAMWSSRLPCISCAQPLPEAAPAT